MERSGDEPMMLFPQLIPDRTRTLLLDVCRGIDHSQGNVIWEKGRQEGGYEKAALGPVLFHPPLSELLATCLSLLGMPEEHDCYLIRVPEGSFVPQHRDPVLGGKEHWRINVTIRMPIEGGHFILGCNKVDAYSGDGILFRPDIQEHRVEKVRLGYLLIWSVGCLKERRNDGL